jgi:hypothetical protein
MDLFGPCAIGQVVAATGAEKQDDNGEQGREEPGSCRHGQKTLAAAAHGDNFKAGQQAARGSLSSFSRGVYNVAGESDRPSVEPRR